MQLTFKLIRNPSIECGARNRTARAIFLAALTQARDEVRQCVKQFLNCYLKGPVCAAVWLARRPTRDVPEGAAHVVMGRGPEDKPAPGRNNMDPKATAPRCG